VICVCDDEECESTCKLCCDTGRVILNPTLNVVLTHPDSFPGCSATGPCKCSTPGKVVIE
jgi:hypothetical protein